MTTTQQIAAWWKNLNGAGKFGFASIVFLVLNYLGLFIAYPSVMFVVTFILLLIAAVIGTVVFFCRDKD